MNSLKRAFDPDLEPSEEELTVCSMTVPSREELWAATLSAPGAAWEYSKAAIPTLEDIRDIDLPSWGDLLALWNAAVTGVQDGWDGSVERSRELYRWLTE
ncbi:hypothetical protein [Ruegeria sp. PrR005]|uniref:Uncharacterized protein n=1 Tax=Ruegeria sp. PrR005 TaxID=2706882 RepID=A0A6B2NZQ8_9RHOB|nr:hypothetical protein [Ruegeria sp. PrR005]NDW47899.1 hypothetical protein [Ruegeria sp. PrR005]